MERLTIGTGFAPPAWERRADGPADPAQKAARGDRIAASEGAKPDNSPRKLAELPVEDQLAAIEKLRASDMTALQSNRLMIDRHEESGQFVYRIFNEDTGETVRRWPPEGYLDLVAFLKGEQGLYDKTV